MISQKRVDAAVASIAERNSSFTPQVPGLQKAWDSTSLGLFKECPTKYFQTIIEGWEASQRSPHLTFGTLLHTGVEIYTKLMAKGEWHDSALKQTIDQIIQLSVERDPEGNAHWWHSDDSVKGPRSLLRTLVWYIEHWRHDPAETVTLSDGSPAVELSFQMELPDLIGPDGEPYILCGHMDRIVEFAGQRWVTDIKTSKAALSSNYFDRYKPDNQMSLYTLAAKVIFDQPVQGVMIDAAQIAVNFSRFQRGFTQRSPAELEEWLEDTYWHIKLAEKMALEQRWPMNDKSCGLYGGCPFREICAKGPSLRPQWLRSHFKPKVWDPLQSRADAA
jgi:hypothetical protein